MNIITVLIATYNCILKVSSKEHILLNKRSWSPVIKMFKDRQYSYLNRVTAFDGNVCMLEVHNKKVIKNEG